MSNQKADDIRAMLVRNLLREQGFSDMPEDAIKEFTRDFLSKMDKKFGLKAMTS